MTFAGQTSIFSTQGNIKDATMDKMQKTFILLLFLCVKTNALDFSPKVSAGLGIERQSSNWASHAMTDIASSFGFSYSEKMISTTLKGISLETNAYVVTVELSQQFNNNVSASLRANLKSPLNNPAGHSLIIMHESPQVEAITRYHLNSVSYGVGVGVKADTFSVVTNPLKPSKNISAFSITPSLSLSSMITLPSSKVELNASLAQTRHQDTSDTDTMSDQRAAWQISSRVSILFDLN